MGEGRGGLGSVGLGAGGGRHEGQREMTDGNKGQIDCLKECTH